MWPCTSLVCKKKGPRKGACFYMTAENGPQGA
nr:MAG TPA: hypothetical protein [Caudoviricetes sp.]DAK02358.1 MAG TPA: hypothetical protein [Caudoviricetes sp.]